MTELHAPYDVSAGRPHPPGAQPDAGGVNFSLFAEHATGVQLLLFARHDDPEPAQVVTLHPDENRTFFFWHVYVAGLRPGAAYAFRVDGPHGPDDLHSAGHRYDRDKVLIDPYSRGNTSVRWDRGAACRPGDNGRSSMRSVVIDTRSYDWEGDRPLNRPMSDTIIYELHVRGFTFSPTAGVARPGTFAGLIEKIPYLQSLGVTAVELLPVCDFDQQEIGRPSPGGEGPLSNFWGYSTLSFFAPEEQFCAAPERGSHVDEFRDLVKAMHRAGIEVILDMVFNHTSEGNQQGPTINFRGQDNSIYYDLKPSDRQCYKNYSGCGNTVNCNHPIVEKLILDCLDFWVGECHVDGFRFDEGSILTRDESGAPMAYPPVIWHIELSDGLRDTKVIAEPWDNGGLYQVGSFPGYRWAVWNGRFRDDIRRFVRGDPGIVGAVASRIAGSADVFQPAGKLPTNSVNFVTCHDGFTLGDLVSYDQKHNEANGEGNRDGTDNNLSWNCGVEGPTDDATIEALRERQVKNFATILFLARGVPMLLAGDEFRRTQRGNNNAYCQDNPVGWVDWTLLTERAGLFRFVQRLIAFRKAHAALRLREFYTGNVVERGLKDIAWHGCRLESPGWSDTSSRVLGFTIAGRDGDADLHAMLNMESQPLDFDVPTVAGRRWFRAIDTALPAPDDIADPGAEPAAPGTTHRVEPHSAVVLVSKQL